MAKLVHFMLSLSYHNKKLKKYLRKCWHLLTIQQADGLDVSGFIPMILGLWTWTQASSWSWGLGVESEMRLAWEPGNEQGWDWRLQPEVKRKLKAVPASPQRPPQPPLPKSSVSWLDKNTKIISSMSCPGQAT